MKKEKTKEEPSRKKSYKKVSFAVKQNAVQKIIQGHWSKRQVSLQYNISYGTLDYWCKRFTTEDQKTNYMGQNKEIRKLKDKIEALEFLKEIQQEMIIDLEDKTGNHELKKRLPEQLIKEIELRRKQRGLK